MSLFIEMLLDQEKKTVEVPNTTPIRASATRTKHGANLLRPRFRGSGWQLQEHNLMDAKNMASSQSPCPGGDPHPPGTHS